MKITITGSLGNISRRLTEQLVAKGHAVTVISHNSEKAGAIRALQAIPAIGSVEDAAFLAQAFSGADAVYTMVPPMTQANNYSHMVQTIGSNLAGAIEKAGVPCVVNLSSIGAHAPAGNGPSSAFYFEEKELYQVPRIHLLHLRAGMFYTNLYGNLEMIRNAQIIGNNFSGSNIVPLSHPHDIADAAAEALDARSFNGKEVRYVVSDEKSGNEIAQHLGHAIGLPGLPWVELADEDLKNGAMQNGFSAHMASLFVELGNAIKSRQLLAHYEQNKPAAQGKRKLEDFAKEFALVYQQ